MEEKHLLFVALMMSIIGISLLYLVYTNATFPESSAVEIENEVSLYGVVQRVEGKKVLIQRELWLSSFDEVKVYKGQRVYIQGSVNEYRGKKEITIQKIKVLE